LYCIPLQDKIINKNAKFSSVLNYGNELSKLTTKGTGIMCYL